MLLARRIVFYIFLGLYLILCPVLILYSLGYIFSPSGKDLSQTGLVYLSTTPPGADIFLENSRYKQKTPASIDGLMPQEYRISLKLKGYRSWTHTVKIENGKAAAFENILLLPNILKDRQISAESYTDLIPMLGTDRILLKTGLKLANCFIYDYRRQELEQIAEPDSELADLPVLSIFSERDSESTVMRAGSLWDIRYLLHNSKDQGNELTEITDLISGEPLNISWSPQREKVLFALYRDHIDRIDTDAHTALMKYFEGVKGFGIYKNWLYLLESDNSVSKCMYDKTNKITLFNDIHLARRLFGRAKFHQINVLDNNLIVFLGDRGQLVTTLAPYIIAERDVQGMEYDAPARKLVFWTKKSIWIADFNIKDIDFDKLFKVRVLLNKVYANGTDIKQCFWAYDGTHILFKDDDEVYLLELSPDNKCALESLVKVKSKSGVFYAEKNGCLYYLDAGSGALRAITIVPKEGMALPSFLQEKHLQE